jgi:Fe-S-cluster containining protein
VSRRHFKRGAPKTAEAAREALAELYAELPKMQCQGLCADSCASVGMTVLEQRHIRETTGKVLPLAHAGKLCQALTVLRQCSVYEARPMICRLWGMVPAMRCNYGCQPEGGWLTDRQAYEFLARVAELAGDHAQARAFREPFEVLGDAEVERQLRGMQKQRDLDAAVAARSATIRVANWGHIVPRKAR